LNIQRKHFFLNNVGQPPFKKENHNYYQSIRLFEVIYGFFTMLLLSLGSGKENEFEFYVKET